MDPFKLYIGIDAGGTKTLLRAVGPAGQAASDLTGPAANAQRQVLAAVAQTLATLLRQVLAQTPQARLQAVCAGIAGAGEATDREALADELRQLLGPDAPPHLLLCHDAEIALEGAFEGGSGVIAIAGTGSIVLARTEEGATRRVGGWGYLLGDEGSGYALGQAGLRAVADVFDGGPATRLQALLAHRHGLDTPAALKQRVYRAAWPLQQVAPLVIEAAEGGDAVAARLVGEATQALAQQVARLAGDAGPLTPRVALLGGLAHEAYYYRAFAEALAAALPGWLLQAPASPPVEGALRLARAADA